MPWASLQKYKLPDNTKEKNGDDTTAAYWQSAYDQDELKAQAAVMMEIIKLEKDALSKVDGYDPAKNKVYIGGMGCGGAVALATYLSL